MNLDSDSDLLLSSLIAWWLLKDMKVNASLIVLPAAIPSSPAIVSAQEISAALIRTASAPKLSISTDIQTLMTGAPPVTVWREGDPVRVKEDIEGQARPAPDSATAPEC
jgi:hypothetical protein